MANEQVSIRLTTQGGEAVLRALEQIGTAAQTQFRKASQEARDFSRVAGDLARIPVPQTPMQVMANAFAGVQPRVEAQQTEERGADMEAALEQADRLRASLAPLFEVEKKHLDTLAKINGALRTGVIDHREAAAAIDAETAAYKRQREAALSTSRAPMMERLSAWTAQSNSFGGRLDAWSGGQRQRAQDQADADRKKAEDSARANAQIADNNRIRASFSPLYDAEMKHIQALAAIDSALGKGIIDHREAAAAIDAETAAYKRQREAALSTSSAPMMERLSAWTAQSNSFGGRLDAWSGGQRQRAEDIAKDERQRAEEEADNQRLVAKHAPLRTAKDALAQDLLEIERLRLAVGLTEEEVGSAIARAQINYTNRANAVADVEKARAGSLSRWDKIDALRQFQDIGVSLVGGQNPLLVGAQQIPQLLDIAARQPEGAIPTIRRFGAAVADYATRPVTLLTAGLVGLAAAAYRYTDQQEQLNRALNGMGRFTGASPDELRATASRAAGSGALTQGQAIAATAQFAGAGIGIENLPTLLGDARRFSHDFGLDLDAAQKEMAQIVSESGLGAFEKRFGAVSAATRDWVSRLEQSGRFAEAAALKTALLHEETLKARDSASLLSKAWEFVISLPGRGLDAIGAGIDAIYRPEYRVELPRPAPVTAPAPGAGSLADYERRLGISVEPSRAERERRLAELRRGSGLAMEAIDQLTPEDQQRRQLQTRFDAIRPFTETAEALAMLGDRAEQARDVFKRLGAALEDFETPAVRMRRDNAVAVRSIGAYGFDARADVAAEQARRANFRETFDRDRADLAAEGARLAALAESRRTLDEMARQSEDRAQLRGLSPEAAARREIDLRYRRLGEQLTPAGEEGATFRARLEAMRRSEILDRQSQSALGSLDRARPDLAELRSLTEARDALREFLSDRQGLAALGPRADEARQALGNLDNRFAIWRPQVETIAQDAALAAQATQAYTFGQRALVAQQQAYLQVMRQTGDATLAATTAEKARVEMIAQGNRAADDMLRQARNESALIGLTPYEAGRERIRQEARDFRAQNVPTGQEADYRSSLPPAVLSPIQIGFQTAGDAAARLADALDGAASRIGAGVGGSTGRGGTAAPTALPTSTSGAVSASDPRGLSGFIRERAAANGLNPDAVLRIARSEGLSEFYGDRGTSFGALQLHVGGGLGDDFRRQTGLDPSDPRNEKAGIDWGLRWMRDHRTVEPWHGAARVGVTNADVFGPGGGAPQEIVSRAGPVSRDAEAERLRSYDWSQIGAQIQSLDAEMQSHVRMLDMQRGALTASDATLQGLTEAQRLYNHYAEQNIDVENATVTVKRDGVLTTVRLKDAILDHGRAAAEAAQAEEDFQRQRRRYIGELDLVRGALSDTGSGVVKAWAHGEDAGEAARNALRSAGDRAIDFSFGQISEWLLGPQGSTSTGWLGSILGIGGGEKSVATMNVKGGVVNVSGAGGGVIPDLLGGKGGGVLGDIVSGIGGLLGGLFKFEAGGVMTSAGALPLHRYASGGIADRPQLALFGEGRDREAYIPLRDPRGIHVRLDPPSRPGEAPRAHVALPDGRGIPAFLTGMGMRQDARRDGRPIDGFDLAAALRGGRVAAFAEGGVMTSAGPAPLPYHGPSTAAPRDMPPLRLSSAGASAAAAGGGRGDQRPIRVEVVDGRGGNKVEVAYATHDEVRLMISANNSAVAEKQQHASLKSW